MTNAARPLPADFVSATLAADRAHTAQLAEINTRYAAADARHDAAHRACRAAHASGDQAAIVAANAEWIDAGEALRAVTKEIVAVESARYPDGLPGGTWGT